MGGGGNCTNALTSIQHHVHKYLDNSDCKAVRLFTMDFSKAFDSATHNMLSVKLKQLPLNPYIVNWYHSFSYARKQRISYNGRLCNWKAVNKETIQGSVSGPYLFIIFLNDLEIIHNGTSASFIFADDGTTVSPVINSCDPSYSLVEQFLTWSKDNRMSCNLSKCKELIFRKKNNSAQYQPINNIPQYSNLLLLGVTFQSNCKFSTHVRLKLNKANKCLHILRTLRKEQYSQKEIDHLFTSLVLPNFTYALPVYGASESDLTSIQNFLDRCYKRRFISYPILINDLLNKQDCKIFKKTLSVDSHPLCPYIPPKKVCSYHLRTKKCARPKH